jgi:hypothetical protein
MMQRVRHLQVIPSIRPVFTSLVSPRSDAGVIPPSAASCLPQKTNHRLIHRTKHEFVIVSIAKKPILHQKLNALILQH